VTGYLKRLLRALAAYQVADVVSKFIAVLLLPVYTRYINPRGYGVVELLGNGVIFISILARFGSEVGISVDFCRLLATRRRKDRFKVLGLINEPNFEQGGKDAYGFWVDKWNGDPIAGAYPVNARWYGEPKPR